MLARRRLRREMDVIHFIRMRKAGIVMGPTKSCHSLSEIAFDLPPLLGDFRDHCHSQ